AEDVIADAADDASLHAQLDQIDRHVSGAAADGQHELVGQHQLARRRQVRDGGADVVRDNDPGTKHRTRRHGRLLVWSSGALPSGQRRSRWPFREGSPRSSRREGGAAGEKVPVLRTWSGGPAGGRIRLTGPRERRPCREAATTAATRRGWFLARAGKA